MNTNDLLTELRLSRPLHQRSNGQASGLPLAALIRSIDPSRTELSPADVERIRQKLDPVVEPSAGRTYLKRQLPRYFSMLMVLGFLGVAALAARGIWWELLAEIYGEDSSNFKWSWLVSLSVWVSLIVCPVIVVVVSVLEYRERGTKASRSSELIQDLIDTGEVAGKSESAILIYIIILGLLIFGMLGSLLPMCF